MAWHRPGDKPLSEPMMVNLLTHICVTRAQWVNFSENTVHPIQYEHGCVVLVLLWLYFIIFWGPFSNIN